MNEDFRAIGQPVAIGIQAIRHSIEPDPGIARYVRVIVNANPAGKGKIGRQAFPLALYAIERRGNGGPKGVGADVRHAVFINPFVCCYRRVVPDGVRVNFRRIRPIRNCNAHGTIGQALNPGNAELACAQAAQDHPVGFRRLGG